MTRTDDTTRGWRRLRMAIATRGPQLVQHPVGQSAIVAVLTLAVTWWLLRKGLVSYEYTDLQVYYGAMDWWVGENRPLYDFTIYLFGNELGFTYPPFAALVFAPFSFVGLATAEVVFTQAALVSFGVAVWWLIRPMVRRLEWPPIFAFAVAVVLAFAIEPVWVTVAIGQINWLVVLLILGDAVLLLSRSSRWAGVGIGLATAIKLTPAVFIIYLLVTRRFRAAATASVTALAATLLAAAVAYRDSWRFWTDALWDTERVGVARRIDNQSLMGMLARAFDVDRPNGALWLVVTVIVTGFGLWRAYRAYLAGDEIAGITLTGLVSALASPVTWIHHLFWVVPAIVIFVDAGMAATGRRRILLMGSALVTWVLFSSVVVWASGASTGILGWLGQDAYVLGTLALLVLLPIRDLPPADHMLSINRSTRSSTERNGSLHKTVR